MLPPLLPHARRAKVAATPVRSSREKLAAIEAMAVLMTRRPQAGQLRVLGRKPSRAGKPGLRVLKTASEGDAAC